MREQQHGRLGQYLYCLDETGSVLAIDHPVIATDRNVHQLVLRDLLGSKFTGYKHRAFNDPIWSNDRDFRAVDDLGAGDPAQGN